MSISPIDWLRGASPQEKPLVAMVVGWQRVVIASQSPIKVFNDALFVLPVDRDWWFLLSTKLTIVAALLEIKDLLDKWQGVLNTKGVVSETTTTLRRDTRAILKPISEFRDVRNLVYHFGDPLTPPDELLAIYDTIHEYDLDELNKLLHALMGVGDQMKSDTMEALSKLRGANGPELPEISSAS